MCCVTANKQAASSSCKQAQRISTDKQYTSKGVMVCRYQLDRVVRINVL